MKLPCLIYIPFLVFITIATACNNGNTSNTSLNDSLKEKPASKAELLKVLTDSLKVAAPIITENDIMDTLNALSFVKESSKIIDSVSHHKHAMAFIIDTTEKEYNVNAGYDREDRFETFYTFSVDRKTRAVKVLDVITGDMITPEEFIKRQKGKH